VLLVLPCGCHTARTHCYKLAPPRAALAGVVGNPHLWVRVGAGVVRSRCALIGVASDG
jgi:hypothetical protein